MNRYLRVGIIASPFIAVVVLLAPYAWPPDRAPTSWFFDVHHQHAPMVSLLSSGLWRDHELPRWNLHDFAGMPTIGDPQAGVYNPVYWLLTMWPSVHAFGLLIIAYALVGGVGFILYARTLGLSITAAAAGGAVFMVGGKLLMHLVLLGNTVYAPVFLAPLLLWALHRAAKNPTPARVAGAASLTGLLVVSLHPQLLFYTAGILLAISLVTVLSAPKRADALGALAMCAVLGVGLAAVHLFPIAGFAGEFSRAQPGLFDPDDRAGESWPGGDWLARVVSGSGVTPEGVLSDWHYYLGGPGLLLMTLGLLAWPRGDYRRRLAWLHGSLALVLLLYGLGPAGGIEPLLANLPVFARFRLPTRALVVLGFPVALLVALGIDALTLAPTTRRRVVGIGTTFGALFLLLTGNAEPLHVGMFVLVLGAAAFLDRTAGSVPSRVVTPSTPVAAMNTETEATSARLGLAAPVAGLLLIIALAVDTCRVVAPFVRTEPEAALRHPADGVMLPDDLPDTIRIAEFDRGLENPGIPQLVVRERELETLAGFNALIPWRFVLYASAAGGFDPFEESFDVQVQLRGRNQPTLFDLLGVTHFLHHPSPDSENWYWERSARAFPRSYLVPGPIVVTEEPGEDALVAEIENLLRLIRLDPRRQVLLQGEAAASALKAAGVTEIVPLEPFRPVPLTERTANRIRLDVQLERPGILVLNEPFFPGWRARDGDAELTVLRANVLFRALALAPGTHRVVFEFSPTPWILGWWVSAVTAGVTFGLLVLGVVRIPHRVAQR